MRLPRMHGRQRYSVDTEPAQNGILRTSVLSCV